jgi:membrane protease YdiL (CAAX protease family)
MSLSPLAPADATSLARGRPVVTARAGGLGAVAAFATFSLALAAGATFGGVSPALLPFVLAFGPTIFALCLAWREGDGSARRLLRTAITRPNRRLWYAAVALPVAWAGTTIAVAIALGQPTDGIFAKTFPAIAFIPLLVLLPAFAEEIAWRGYAVTRLLPSMSPLAAALALGVPWAALHLFLQLPGQMNAGLEVWPTVVSLLGYSILLTWLFVASGGSVLLTALVHTGLNGVAPLMGGLEPDRTWAIRALLVALIAVAVVVAGGVHRRAQPAARA